MRVFNSLLVATAITASGTPGLAEESDFEGTVRLLQRLATQYAILAARMFIDLTYDSITIEPGTNDLIVTGLRLYPELEWDLERQCTITVDRLVASDANSFDKFQSSIEVSGLSVPALCFDPEIAGTMSSFGYEGLLADTAAIDIAYDIPSSSADLSVQASIVDAADLGLSAHFQYLWFRVPTSPDPSAPPEPVARLTSAELVLENNGLWDALEPMMEMQLGDLNAIPQLVQMGVSELLTEGGTRMPSPEETAFVENLAAEIARFVAEKDRIVITAAPEGGSVLLTEEMLSSPYALIAALDPIVSAIPDAYRRMIAPAELASALAGGDNLDAELRLRVGEALVTGIGAPRSIAAGRTLLAPLAEQWDAEAALLTARAAQEAHEPEAAYRMALRAMAGGETAAIAIADAVEPELSLASILGAQSEATDRWPGASEARAAAERLIGEGDVAGMRRRAYAAATGRGRPRDHAEAYYWASLAAAAGDRGAASLRSRMEERFGGREGWQETADAQSAAALDAWTTGGLAETISDRTR